MSELIEKFHGLAKHGTPKDKADAIKVIDEQIEMTIGAIEDVSPTLVGREEKIKTLKGYVADLRGVKKLLS